MTGKIEIKLPYFKRFLFLRFKAKIKAGFLFWNEAILITCRNVGIDMKDFFTWAEKNQTLYFSEQLYGAYLLWCRENYTKPKLTKQDLLWGFSNADEADQKKVMETWKESESFGVRDDKKKVKGRK